MRPRWRAWRDAADHFGWSIRPAGPNVAIMGKGTRRIMVVLGKNDRLAYAETWEDGADAKREQIKGGVLAVQEVMAK